MTTPEKEPQMNDQPEEISESASLRQQLDELRESISELTPQEEGFARTVLEIDDLDESKRTEEQQNILNALSVELGLNLPVLEAMKKVMDQVRGARGELVDLAEGVNAANPELAEHEGNPAKNPAKGRSMIPLLLYAVDGALGKMSDKIAKGERSAGFIAQINTGIRNFILSSVERFAAIKVPLMKSTFSLLSSADIQALEDYRYEENVALMGGNETLVAQFKANEETFEKNWRMEYQRWIKDQRGSPPSLADIVVRAPAQQQTKEAPAETPAEQPAQVAGMFAEGSLSRKIENNPQTPIVEIGSMKLRFHKTKSFLVQDSTGGSKPFAISKGDDSTALVLDELTRENPELTDPGQFQLKVGADSFKLADLVKKIDELKSSGEKTVEMGKSGLKLSFA